MVLDKELLYDLISDLGLNHPFVKGATIPVKRCWHFCTDGNAVDIIFYDEEDFINGMNRIYVTLQNYHVVILAFCLMDNHLHFVLHGDFDQCNRFMHDYVRRTSHDISVRHNEQHKLENVPIHHQVVDTDFYLKVVICYTIKNAPVAGIRHNAWSYPWSSGPLYFNSPGYWCSPGWMMESCKTVRTEELGFRSRLSSLKTKQVPKIPAHMVGPVVLPGDYVAYEIVEKLFKTNKSFNFFLCITKEDDVEARGGSISHLSIPIQEMRQHKNDICLELFGVESTKTLSTSQRLKLARTMRARYNSSLKQIIRLSGLVYDEVKDLL